VFAEDISDFEIEGMSVGDSLLDYFSEEEIKKGNKRNYPGEKFYEIELSFLPNFKEYDSVVFNLKNNDNHYKLFGIIGLIFYFNDINECIAKKNEIEKEISLIMNHAEKINHGTIKHWYDKSKKSTITQLEFLLNISNDSIVISCYDWSEEITKELNWHDHLRVELYSKEFADLLRELQSQ